MRSIPSLLKAETTIVGLLNAMEIQAEQGLKWSLWGDLTIAAQMKRLGINEIYSNDRDFDPRDKRIF